MSCIAVVGGSGFIGTRLCEALQAVDAAFRIVDKRVSEKFPERTIVADVTRPDTLLPALSGCDAIVNLAAEHHDNVRPRSLYDDVNVGGARNLCAVAERVGIARLVFTSSVACYGFAPPNTGEDGTIRPFNDYGRTKAEAEEVYRQWQALDADARSLVIVRPTVAFGERNRGNVYNLLHQIASGRFLMIGSGNNCKSMAYVENVAAFLQYSLAFGAGVQVFNYVDKPDFDMNSLVALVRQKLGQHGGVGMSIPYWLGWIAGSCLDLVSRVSGRTFTVSAVRVKKFCATTQFTTAIAHTGFTPPVTLQEGLQRTVQYEFLEDHSSETLHYSE